MSLSSIRAAHQDLPRSEISPVPDPTRAVQTRPGLDQDHSCLNRDHWTTMYCGYVFLLFLGLWAELGAGRALKDLSTQLEMQSIIEDLQAALQDYSSILQQTSSLKYLPVLPCTETATHLEQSSMLVHRLSQYQKCAERLISLCPDAGALCRVITLNQDLLQHLRESHQDSAGCPSSPSSLPSDFDSVRRSIQCVECWSLQVAALRR